jgi:hypothetical protein
MKFIGGVGSRRPPRPPRSNISKHQQWSFAGGSSPSTRFIAAVTSPRGATFSERAHLGRVDNREDAEILSRS